MELIYIEWIDSCYDEDAVKADELEPVYLIKSCGFLVKETVECYSIAPEYHPLDGKFQYVISIPKGCIKKIKRWRMA